MASATPVLGADDTYVPDTPPGPGFDGSVSAACVDLAPRIQYSISRVDAATTGGASATLQLSGAGAEMSIPLQVDASGEGSGSVLWPGVEVASDGAVTALPGWRRDGESWEPSEVASWTTGAITARLVVGGEWMAVPLQYPSFSEGCATPVGVASSGGTATPGGLAATGGELPIALAAGGAVALGVGTLMLLRRRRRSLL